MYNNTGFRVIDSRGRPMISVNDNGRIAITRYPDMNDNCKNYIVKTYTELTDEKEGAVRDFLDYKKEEFQFCS